jgi:hypothetical protein
MNQFKQLIFATRLRKIKPSHYFLKCMNKIKYFVRDSIENEENDNIDVDIVVGSRVYVVSFFTVRNLDFLLKNQDFYEGKKAIWENDMVVVANLKMDNLEKAIIEIVSSGNIGKIGTYMGTLKQICEDNYVRFCEINWA